METKISFDVPYLNFGDDFKITKSNRSSIIFGTNGMGKSSIYKAIKEYNPQFAYIDYGNMKNEFLNSKNKIINITPHAQEYHKLIEEKEQNNSLLNIRESLKKFDLTSVKKVSAIAPKLKDVQKTKTLINKVTIRKGVHQQLANIRDNDIRFLSQNLKELKELSTLTEDISILKEEYIKDVLVKLSDNLPKSCSVCPVCDSSVPNLLTIINEKIDNFKVMQNELLIEFRKHNKESSQTDVIKKFEQIVEVAKIVTEKDICDYILVPKFEDVSKYNSYLSNNKQLEKEILSVKKEMINSFNNLKNKESEYITYISNKFGVEAIFCDKEYSIKLELERHPKQYSTGEFNLILFTTKIFEYIGSDKELMILDDPISSYDIINQYKIAFDIVSSNINGQKNFIIFTHNMSLINLINTQQRGLFNYKVLDKCNDIINIYNFNCNEPDSIMTIDNLLSKSSDMIINKFINLSMDRDKVTFTEKIKREIYDLFKEDSESKGKLNNFFKKEKENKNKMHKLFHYDDIYNLELEYNEEDIGLLTNCELVRYVEDLINEGLNFESYPDLVCYKIILMIGLRVWIEKKIFEGLNGDSNLNNKTLVEKINYVLPRDKESKLINIYPNLNRSDLMSKKVMLNQNIHYKSQGEPFYYVMNLSYDDIYYEINEIKKLFEN